MGDVTRRLNRLSFQIWFVRFAEANAVSLFVIVYFFTIPLATGFQIAALHEVFDIVVQFRFRQQFLITGRNHFRCKPSIRKPLIQRELYYLFFGSLAMMCF